jgi:outer membrane protein assembly factor BamA
MAKCPPVMLLGWAVASAVPAGAQQAVRDSAVADSGRAGIGRFFPLPAVFYQPETGWGFGGALLHTGQLARDARTGTNFLALIYTLKKQYAAQLASELYTAGNRFVIVGEVGGSHFPDKFYGLGNATLADTSEDYTLDQVKAALEVRVRLLPRLYLGPSVLYQWAAVKDTAAGGFLAGGAIPGSLGGTVTGLGAVLTLDTREHSLAPRSGAFVVLRARLQDEALGSDYDYLRYELDARWYTSVIPRHVLALQLGATGSTGEPPFFDLAKLGGANVFRGSYEGRFRDRQRIVAQAEYRLPVWGPLGVTLFGAAGQVTRSWGDLRPGDLHYAGGGGVRFVLSREERVSLRIDVGFGPGESGVYFALGEAF